MLEAVAFDVAVCMARVLPIDAVSNFGAWLGRTVGPWTGAHRIARRNLQIAFPQADAAWVVELLGSQWAEFGRTMCELLILDRIAAAPDRLEIVGVERLAEIADGAGPVVFISGHFSCFELMPCAIVRAGIPCQITYRAMNNPHVDARVRRNRFRYGVRLFAPKGLDGARELMRGLQRGDSVALMNDQKFNGGVAAPLFGRLAHTAPGPHHLRPAVRHPVAADECRAHRGRAFPGAGASADPSEADRRSRRGPASRSATNQRLHRRVRPRPPERMVLGPQALAERHL